MLNPIDKMIIKAVAVMIVCYLAAYLLTYDFSQLFK